MSFFLQGLLCSVALLQPQIPPAGGSPHLTHEGLTSRGSYCLAHENTWGDLKGYCVTSFIFYQQ